MSKEKPNKDNKKPATQKAKPAATVPDGTPDVRRPANTPDMTYPSIAALEAHLNSAKTLLETYAAHLRALDRKRLNGVGLKKQGFIERALALAYQNQEFLPHYLTFTKFQNDNLHFGSFRILLNLNKQIEELLWNLTIEASDMVYTDALEFYASVREAAKRRVDAAEALHLELKEFFTRRSTETGEPTAKQVKRDVNALLKGKKDGKIIVENIKPKVIGGTHKVIDEHFNDSIKIRETDDEEINE